MNALKLLEPSVLALSFVETLNLSPQTLFWLKPVMTETQQAEMVAQAPARLKLTTPVPALLALFQLATSFAEME